MEDSVGEQERREQEEAVAMAQGKKRGREEEQEEAGGGRVVVGKEEVVPVVEEEAGFLSSMASKIGAAMSGTNGTGAADAGNGNAVSAAAVGQDEEQKDGNGIFHKLLHSSSPSPPVTGKDSRVYSLSPDSIAPSATNLILYREQQEQRKRRGEGQTRREEAASRLAY
jgi:hypothetical protein